MAKLGYHQAVSRLLTDLIKTGSCSVVTDMDGIRIASMVYTYRIHPTGYLLRVRSDDYGRTIQRERFNDNQTWEDVT